MDLDNNVVGINFIDMKLIVALWTSVFCPSQFLLHHLRLVHDEKHRRKAENAHLKGADGLRLMKEQLNVKVRVKT